MHYDDEDAFLAVTAEAEKTLFGDAESMTLLGAGYEFFRFPQGAEKAYAPRWRERRRRSAAHLAGALIRQGHPGEAEPLLADVFEQKQEANLWAVALLVEGTRPAASTSWRWACWPEPTRHSGAAG